MKLIRVIVAYCGQGGRDFGSVSSVPRLGLADDGRPNDLADCHDQAGTLLRFSPNPLSEPTHEFVGERDPPGKRDLLRIADVADCGQGGWDLASVAPVSCLGLADDCCPNDLADCHSQAGTVLPFSPNPLSEPTHEFLSERDPLGRRDFLRIADVERQSCPAAPAQSDGTVRGRFQFSVAGLMGAVGIFGAALWVLRAGLDAKMVEIVAASVIVLPVILAVAVDKLSGGRAGGNISIAWAYCQLAATAWLLAVLSIGMDAVSDSILRPVAVMLVGG